MVPPRWQQVPPLSRGALLAANALPSKSRGAVFRCMVLAAINADDADAAARWGRQGRQQLLSNDDFALWQVAAWILSVSSRCLQQHDHRGGKRLDLGAEDSRKTSEKCENRLRMFSCSHVSCSRDFLAAVAVSVLSLYGSPFCVPSHSSGHQELNRPQASFAGHNFIIWEDHQARWVIPMTPHGPPLFLERCRRCYPNHSPSPQSCSIENYPCQSATESGRRISFTSGIK